MNKLYIFRLNAGDAYGLGHYYRTMALASRLKQMGERVILVHNENSFWQREEVVSMEKRVVSSHPESIDESLLENLIVQHGGQATVFIDGNINYSKEFWLKLNKEFSIPIINYQNLTESRFFCNYFILPSIHQKEDFFEGFDNDCTTIYQGLEYFTFNDTVLSISPKSTVENITNVAITTGGSDPKNLTYWLFQAIQSLRNFKFTFFLGNNYIYRDEFSRLKLPDNISVSDYNIQKIVENDVVVSAFGVSTYELLALRMPVIAIGHQKSNAIAADYLAQQTEALISLGCMDEIKKSEIASQIISLAQNPSRAAVLVRNAANYIDLKGNDRVLNIITNAEL